MSRNEIKKYIEEAIRERYGDTHVTDFSVVVPEIPDHGDFATNAALIIGKKIKKNPMEVALVLAESLRGHKEFKSVEVAAPGFINFILNDAALLRELGEMLHNQNTWGTSAIGNGKTVIVEYFQLNIAKRPHVGHLRSAVIGDAIKRMLLSQGYAAVSDTHVGDWGTQFGILLHAYEEADEATKQKIEDDPFNELETLYQDAQKKEDIVELGKKEFARLEQGDEEKRKIWEWMVAISMKKLEESARRLALLPFDEHKGESAYEKMMPAIVEEALQKNVAKKTEEGAVIVDLTNESLDEAILIKSDGASTYLLRDLATIKYRSEHWKFWHNLYIVDVRQSHHFRQLLRVAELLGLEGAEESRHIEYGFMKLPEGMISTRKGVTISLETVLDEATDRARMVIQEKNPELKNADHVAEMVGLAAIKYFDLSHNRRSDITFRWDEALSFEGDTGPYLQYTYARLKSILRKLGEQKTNLPIEKATLDTVEHRLLASLLYFPEAITDALSDFMPNILAHYLYQLAGLANEFYHARPVTQELDEMKRNFRIALVSGVAITLSKGLSLLGIEAPEEM